MLRVVAPGALTLLQDGGRHGATAMGVGRGGAVDQAALAAANLAVGNPPDAVALEAVLDGLVLEALAPCMVAISATGAPVTPRELGVGDVVRVATGALGLRRYVAVRGGIAAERVLGSSATDLFAGIGPAPLQAGDVLTLGDAVTGFPETVADPPLTGPVRVHPGPRVDWFAAGAFEQFVATAWRVTAASDRTAARLTGPPLVRVIADELLPEGLLPGAVQVPPSGEPIVFLADHPVTGGYPVIGVVDPADLRLVGQARPGAALTLVAG